MKRSFLVCFLLTTLMLVSCGSDDDGGINNSIIGTWKLTNAAEGDGTPIMLLDCEENTTFTFTENMFTTRSFEANQDRTDCLPVEESTATYRTNGNLIELLDADGNVIVPTESQLSFAIAADVMTIRDTDPGTGNLVLELVFARQ